ncbi:S26 family signal peptidase [Dactylosporangium sp. NPDC051484]|uniref:S26 family signal peptidase n=1 Tax=Dactylosporangium sp. NPDC051484 TaxID=3154942 RepID=UPI00344BE857
MTLVWIAMGLLAVGALLVVLARRRLLVVTVRGDSMRPSFADGDVLLAFTGRRPAVGDVVVFRHPIRDGRGPVHLVKRVAAVAGDPVPADIRRIVDCDLVPPRRLVVSGDNPTGLDSRRLGFIDVGEVSAVVGQRLMPARMR